MNDHQHILHVVQNYFEGIFNGDVPRLRSAFHPQATLFGEVKGAPYYRTLDDYLAAVAQRQCPRDLGEPFAMKALALDVQGPIAVARLQVPMLGFNYIDFLSLLKTDGQWQIVSKNFTHVDASASPRAE